MTCFTLMLSLYMCEPPPPPLTELPALITFYDPYLCPPAVVCLQTNGDGYFADMTPVSPDLYNRIAACPMDLHGRHVAIPSLGYSLRCADTFGTLDGEPVATVDYSAQLGWHIRIDIFTDLVNQPMPAGNYTLQNVQWGGS